MLKPEVCIRSIFITFTSMNEKRLILGQYRKYAGREPVDIIRMPLSGSDRRYFRIIEEKRSIIGSFNPNLDENRAFIGLSNHFSALKLPVPEIIYSDPGSGICFLQDLGDTNLFTWLGQKRQLTGTDEEVADFYREILDRLVEFQVEGIKGLDTGMCYPHRSFDHQSMMWDLNYFKYMFLKLVSVPFNEKRLETDFERLVSLLLEAGQDYFLYRDFQSANIMVLDNHPWFIDYQGGRLGAAQYDMVSLLYDSKAHLPQQLREVLIEHYIKRFCSASGEDETLFRKYVPGFTIIRIMQALGAYGYRGLFEQKPGFVQSIFPAVRDLVSVIESGTIGADLPELSLIIDKIHHSNRFEALKEPETLRITVSSFSYMNGIPGDRIHGGGFVFDCRSLDDPSKLPEFRDATGKDARVADYLNSSSDTAEFISDALSIIKRSAAAYKKKNYTSLSVSFGSAIGQHRSVYCAEMAASEIRSLPSIEVLLNHRDLQE